MAFISKSKSRKIQWFVSFAKLHIVVVIFGSPKCLKPLILRELVPVLNTTSKHYSIQNTSEWKRVKGKLEVNRSNNWIEKEGFRKQERRWLPKWSTASVFQLFRKVISWILVLQLKWTQTSQHTSYNFCKFRSNRLATSTYPVSIICIKNQLATRKWFCQHAP